MLDTLTHHPVATALALALLALALVLTLAAVIGRATRWAAVCPRCHWQTRALTRRGAERAGRAHARTCSTSTTTIYRRT